MALNPHPAREMASAGETTAHAASEAPTPTTMRNGRHGEDAGAGGAEGEGGGVGGGASGSTGGMLPPRAPPERAAVRDGGYHPGPPRPGGPPLEFVLVVPRARLFDDRYPHGLEVFGPGDRERVVGRIRDHGFFVERRHAERDLTLKQVIPYAVLERDGALFLMRRLGKGGEARLHGKLSVGVGGHVNPVDGAADPLEEGLRREIEEEVEVEGGWDAAPVGILNDDATAVGAVHFGLVYRVRAKGPARVREREALEGGFEPRSAVLERLRSDRSRFETWSALLLDRLDEVIPSAT
jgi:predicted NUDIX family phosphoesterase